MGDPEGWKHDPHGRRRPGGLFQPLLRVPVPWVFVVTYFVGVGLESAFGRSRPPVGGRLVTIAGIALFMAGAALAGWGWLIFHKAGTTKTPGQSSTTLVTRGPYRITRNPMYVGLAAAYLGEAGILNQVWPVLVLPLALAYVHWIVIPVEEARLRESFGAAYARYRARVRRWL